MQKAFFLVPAVFLAGCVSMPEGPGVMVLPGSGKSFDQFRFDDYECRQFASSQIGGSSPNQAATDSGVNWHRRRRGPRRHPWRSRRRGHRHSRRRACRHQRRQPLRLHAAAAL